MAAFRLIFASRFSYDAQKGSWAENTSPYSKLIGLVFRRGDLNGMELDIDSVLYIGDHRI